MLKDMKIMNLESEFCNESGVYYEKPFCGFDCECVNEYNRQYEDRTHELLHAYARTPNEEPISEQEVQNHFLMNGFTELILKVTDECNLRCKYCVYSDHYPYTQDYGSSAMDLKTGISAVNHYMGLLVEQRKYLNKVPFIAFYGGEPLMNFELIRGVIEHVKDKYREIPVNYTITTNGLLLKNPDIVRYLKENKVIICLSLDGYRENHDRNRVNHNNAPTYNELIDIVERSFTDYPLIYSLCCIDYRTDMEKLYDHYMENDRISGGKIPHVLRISQISDIGTDYYKQFTAEERSAFIASLRNLESRYIGLAKRNEHNWLLDMLIGQELLRIFDRPRLGNRSGYFFINGACVPGEKIFVRPDGSFGICEKVGIDSLTIGNVETGLDYSLIVKRIKQLNAITKTKCANCELSMLCNVCYAQMTSLNEIGYTDQDCVLRKSGYIHRLQMIAEIENANPGYFKGRIRESIERNRNASLQNEALDIYLQ